MEWRRSGDFRQRERRAERATQRRVVVQRSRAAAQTHEAIERFEDVLKAEQERANRDIDDLPAEAEAGTFGSTFRSTITAQAARWNDSGSDEEGSPFRKTELERSQSEPQVRQTGPIDNDPCMMRPPSPLSYYNYGSLSVKPRSTFAQHKQRAGESTRAKFRQTSPGFYFPGPQFKQGPYGFSMLDPCLIAPRPWDSTTGQPPHRQENDAGDVRPLSSEQLGHRRNFVEAPKVSDSVRTTKAHTERALMAFRNVDKNREEKLLEQVRFEKGMYEGRWRDPMLEAGHVGQLPEENPEEKHDWLGANHEEMDSRQQLGSRILFGLQSCLRTCRGKVTNLFAAENRAGPAGVLEPQEFLAGLVRLGIVDDGELSVHDVIQAMTTIDPNFDGRVNLPVINRAVNAAHKVQGERTQAAQQVERQFQAKLSTSYTESLPVEVVKVDRESRSLFNFERSFEKFRSQQRILLAHHNELGGGLELNNELH